MKHLPYSCIYVVLSLFCFFQTFMVGFFKMSSSRFFSVTRARISSTVLHSTIRYVVVVFAVRISSRALRKVFCSGWRDCLWVVNSDWKLLWDDVFLFCFVTTEKIDNDWVFEGLMEMRKSPKEGGNCHKTVLIPK